MLTSIDLQTALNWRKYQAQELTGELRDDYRTALVAHTMASLWSKKPPALEKFVLAHLLKPASTEPEPDLQQQFMNLAAMGIGKWQPKTL